MNGKPDNEMLSPGVPGSQPDGSNADGIDCDQCRRRLDSFVEDVLVTGVVPEDRSIPRHLEECPTCSQDFIQLIDLSTAPQVRALQDALLDPARAPDQLEGLIKLWQLQLAASVRLDDTRDAAVGLSVVGMVHRQRMDRERAASVHELALQSGVRSDDALSLIISRTDLAYLALLEGRTDEARGHLRAADRAAEQTVDPESQARIHVLVGRSWEQDHEWQTALAEYGVAGEKSMAADSADVLAIADESMRRVAAISHFAAALRAIADGAAEPLRSAAHQILAQMDQLGAALPDLLAEAFGVRPRLQYAGTPVLPSFGRRVLQEEFSLASSGDFLVVNTAEQIPGSIVAGPYVDLIGRLVIGLNLDAAAMQQLPAVFFIDLLYIPAAQVVRTVRVGYDARDYLTEPRKGLRFRASLPGFEGIADKPEAGLPEEDTEQWRLPRASVALRIWWPEGEGPETPETGDSTDDPF